MGAHIPGCGTFSFAPARVILAGARGGCGMDAKTIETWRHATTLIHRSLAGHRTHAGLALRCLGIATRDVGARGGEWTSTDRRRLVRVDLAREVRGGRAPDPLLRPDAMTAARKALVLGHAVAGRGWHAIPAHEWHGVHRALNGSPTFADFLAAMPSFPAARVARQPTGPVTFDFTFTYAGAGNRVMSAIGNHHVSPATDDEAPVVARLKTPSGTWLDVRRLGDDFLRPVLAPGSWTPIGIDDFIAAVGSGTPWNDNPFLRESKGDGIGFPLVDYAIPEDAKHPSPKARVARDMAGEAVRDAGALHVIGGIVHRRAPEPRLVLGSAVHGDGHGGKLRHWDVTWRMGGLGGMASMETLGPAHERPWITVPPLRDAFDLTGLPLGALDEARAVASSLSDPSPEDEDDGPDPFLPVTDLAGTWPEIRPEDWTRLSLATCPTDVEVDPHVSECGWALAKAGETAARRLDAETVELAGLSL